MYYNKCIFTSYYDMKDVDTSNAMKNISHANNANIVTADFYL